MKGEAPSLSDLLRIPERTMNATKKQEKIRYHMTAPVVNAESSWPIQKAIRHMFKHKVHSLLIKEKDAYVGIVTESDLIFKVLLEDIDRETAPIRAIMSPAPYTMDVEKTLGQAVAYMREKNIRHLPVTEKKEIIGMLSVRDLITYFAK